MPQRCSFCGKSKAELGDIAIHQSALGKGEVRICNECVELCHEILDDEQEIDATQTASHPPGRHSQPAQHCSLCYKHLPEVRGLLAVTDGISICNECVSLAHLLFQGQAAPPDSADVTGTFLMFDWVRNSRMKHVVGISEIVLWVADKEASLRFYRDLLGLEVISPPELRNTFLRVGEGNAGIPQMIVLVPKTEEVLGKPSGYQLHHLALELPLDRFDLQHEALVQAGYQPRPGKHPVLPSRTMYVDDPDGNEVEFICRFGN
ncbi:MAG TPA: ClpX C4-type zinc finger protein [Chloroflexia bacterium]|jgi:catechol 2,3-dioxygenase-like lactoylglutathione lyase family enzyme